MLKSLFSDGQALRLKPNIDPRMWIWCYKFLLNCNAAKSRLNTSRKVRLCRYSQQQLQALTDQEHLEYDRISKGLLYVYRDPGAFERGVANMSVLSDNGLPLELLDENQIIAHEPVLAAARGKLAGGIFCPSDESGDAHLFTRDLTRRCVELGVTFLYDTEITAIHAVGDRIDHVATSGGKIEADRFVLALGSFSPGLARPLGYSIAVYPVKGYSVTLPVESSHTPPELGGVDEANLVAWARFGQRLRFTATAEFSGFDKQHQPSDFTHMLQAARDLFPNGANYDKPNYWAGLRPMTPEGMPIVSRTRHKNLFFNTGHGHMGWTMSCGTARILTDLVCDRTPDIDMTGLAYEH
jgi:D-amino-acid dehydrogenase